MGREPPDDDSIRIVEVDENPALYAEAHIPGAIGFDWKRDLQDQVKRDFLGPADFGELFGSRGISNDHTIVLYGDRNNWFAAYTYWYLKYYGHDNVKLVTREFLAWPVHELGVCGPPHDLQVPVGVGGEPVVAVAVEVDLLSGDAVAAEQLAEAKKRFTWSWRSRFQSKPITPGM